MLLLSSKLKGNLIIAETLTYGTPEQLSVNESSVLSLSSMHISAACLSPTYNHDFLRHFGFRDFWLLSFGFLWNTFPWSAWIYVACPPRSSSSHLLWTPELHMFSLPPCLKILEVFLLRSFSSFVTCPSGADTWNSVRAPLGISFACFQVTRVTLLSMTCEQSDVKSPR
jgi:hypothetical protein